MLPIQNPSTTTTCSPSRPRLDMSPPRSSSPASFTYLFFSQESRSTLIYRPYPHPYQPSSPPQSRTRPGLGFPTSTSTSSPGLFLSGQRDILTYPIFILRIPYSFQSEENPSHRLSPPHAPVFMARPLLLALDPFPPFALPLHPAAPSPNYNIFLCSGHGENKCMHGCAHADETQNTRPSWALESIFSLGSLLLPSFPLMRLLLTWT
ncbi:hypothetical protein C8R45DRAFT_543741 [Mycena sanguinolenta]|nr:hypothetical protein C8R45DRAFT_543741 [Mycena sanguinolenta]